MKDKLEIILITYNRKQYLEETLNQLFAENSPVKDFSITVLNNASTDGTTKLLEEYSKKYPNLKHICHKINIGGNANIVRAFETATKEYLWLLGDNDKYSWDSWNEVEKAINENYDVIVTRTCKNNIADIYYTASLISGCIYKMSNFTETVFVNAYDNIRFLFPHLAFCAKNINDNNKFYIVSKDIVFIGINPNMPTTYNRGLNFEEIPKPRFNILWSVGYITSVELINNRKKQIEIIEGLRHYHRTLFDLFKSIVVINNIQKNGYFYNYQQIFRLLTFKQKLKFIWAFLVINLSYKNYKYCFIRDENSWLEYLNSINEQKYINKLSKNFKNKKILLYGAGLTAKVLLKNFDLSSMNIIGIADKKFESFREESFMGYKTYTPNEINNIDVDIILFTLKDFKRISNILKKDGCNKKMYSIIKKNNYVLEI